MTEQQPKPGTAKAPFNQPLGPLNPTPPPQQPGKK